MSGRGPAEAPATVVVTQDSELLDDVLAVAAAAGVEPQVSTDAGSLRPVWGSAAMVVVGVDQAERVAGLVLPRRTEVYVVGHDSRPDAVFEWSVPLGAAVVLLPSGSSWLTAALADATELRLGPGGLVAVVGGCGGVGASTLAAGLAVVAAQGGASVLVVDVDGGGGGLDLLLGIERVEGWRWPRLAGARGHLGDLTGHLPRVDGVDVLSMGRGRTREPDAEQLKAVLSSAVRSHELVVVDLPARVPESARDAVRRADSVLLVVRADLRGIAAARQTALELDDVGRLGLVVRTARTPGLDPAVVGDALGLPVFATLPDDPLLRTAVERRDLPGRAARSSLGRTAQTLLDQLVRPDRAA